MDEDGLKEAIINMLDGVINCAEHCYPLYPHVADELYKDFRSTCGDDFDISDIRKWTVNH